MSGIKIVGAVTTLTIAAMATPIAAADRTGFLALEAGEWTAAERELLAERRIHPRRPELMINLAAVYANSGRYAEARALYAEVLDRPAVAMDMPSGEVQSSHALAHAGLRRAPSTLAASHR